MRSQQRFEDQAGIPKGAQAAKCPAENSLVQPPPKTPLVDTQIKAQEKRETFPMVNSHQETEQGHV